YYLFYIYFERITRTILFLKIKNELPYFTIKTNTKIALVDKIDDLFEQIFQYIENNEEYFKSQMEDIYVKNWDKIKSTAESIYITYELRDFAAYIEFGATNHPEELFMVMHDALTQTTPFQLFYQLKHLKDFVEIEGDLYDDIIDELDEIEKKKTVFLYKDLNFELEKKFILLGYNFSLRDITFDNEDDNFAYKHNLDDPWIIYKNAQDVIDGYHYLEGHYF
ncbi:MAG TPA: hypothetical protein VIG94_01275, partial [Faecalibacter sp.]